MLFRMAKQFYVYILTNQKNGTLYIGVTNNLRRRLSEHKQGLIEGFTKKYRIHLLVYYETYSNPTTAIAREKCLKEWHRAWKLKLIDSTNPRWRDLSSDWGA